MPKPKTKTEYPEHIRPYAFHGLDLTKDGDNWVSDCPFCGRENKLSIHEATGQGRCFVCQVSDEEGKEGFNIYGFLRLLHTLSKIQIGDSDLQKFSGEKGIVNWKSLLEWGMCRSVLGYHNWLLPGYSPDGKITQLYRLAKVESGKSVMLPTPGLGLKLLGLNLHVQSKGTLYLCEGYKDSIRLWETLRTYKLDEESGECVKTANVKAALLADANVLGLPGLGFIGKDQLNPYHKIFAGKRIVLCFDSDHPRMNNGKLIESAGFSGVRRAAGILSAITPAPKEISYLKWGESGYDEDRKSGFDLSDLLANTH